ncbi:hypothetical protein [Metapseudomonas furukawaii]|uniref:hypothetical protein n=1 Tax=Metapseudomonas furukawaii TaxID=1149133 RepID=UPI00103EDD71|nr:hypothetical protein [Pseudomonas furukawaii]
MGATAALIFDSSAELNLPEHNQTARPFSAAANSPRIHASSYDYSALVDLNEPDNSLAKPQSPIEQPAQTRILHSFEFECSFVAEQEWEGCVTWFDDKQFHAHLLDLTNEGIEEEAVFDIGEISSIHHDLLKEGALFRWSIGYQRQKGGTRSKVSSLVFRRLPAWSARDIERSKKEADDLLADLQWD